MPVHLGINSAFRASELLSLDIDHVAHLNIGDRLDVRQRKTKKYRGIILNASAHAAIQNWLAAHPGRDPALFLGKRGRLTVPTVTNLVKSWVRRCDIPGKYGSHSLRKTWGYFQRTENNAPLPLLMEAFGHATQQQTLAYLGIEEKEIEAIYGFEL